MGNPRQIRYTIPPSLSLSLSLSVSILLRLHGHLLQTVQTRYLTLLAEFDPHQRQRAFSPK